jgi:XTP/dITP diphosphohydrolase
MKKLLIASGNLHKVQEIKEILKDFNLEIFSVKDLEHPVSEPIENGVTFKENAEIKARAYVEVFDGWILADDSGISVKELKGDPGVFSARYAGLDATDEDNREKLKNELIKIEKKDSSAYFTCSLCLIHPNRDKMSVFESQWHGMIKIEESGVNGFGYDPLFYLEDSVESAADIDDNEKNKISHRGQALQLLKEQSRSLFNA